MTIHIKAAIGLIESEKITPELLNERDNYYYTVWHRAAQYTGFKHIPKHFFTIASVTLRVGDPNSTNEFGKHGDTVLHIAAAHDNLKYIDKEFLTNETLAFKNSFGMTVWQVAAKHGTLKDLPLHLLTLADVEQVDDFCCNLLHSAAQGGSVQDISVEHLSEHALNQLNNYGDGFREHANAYGKLKSIPANLITNDFLDACRACGAPLFDDEDKKYFKEFFHLSDEPLKIPTSGTLQSSSGVQL